MESNKTRKKADEYRGGGQDTTFNRVFKKYHSEKKAF